MEYLRARIVIVSLIAAVTVLGAAACKGPAPSPPVTGKSSLAPGDMLRIDFDLSGDDIGAPEYQQLLHRLAEAVRTRTPCRIVSTGFGQGSMFLVVRASESTSIESLKQVSLSVYPKARITMKPAGTGE